MPAVYEFEPKVDFQRVMGIIGMVRSGNVGTVPGEFLKEVGSLVGEIGAFRKSVSFAAADERAHDLPCNLDECCDEVEASIESFEAGVATVATSAAINPALIALLIRLAELLLAKYLS